jgi:hypothetical protein
MIADDAGGPGDGDRDASHVCGAWPYARQPLPTSPQYSTSTAARMCTQTSASELSAAGRTERAQPAA